MRALVVAVGLLFASGCSVASLKEDGYSPTKNQCKSDDDCGGGTCDQSHSVCVASEGQFATVLFEITPPSSSAQFSGVRFLQTLDGISTAGGGLDLKLPAVATVQGQVTPTRAKHQPDCALSYGGSATVPVKISFTPTERLLGLSSESYTASTVKEQDYGFELSVPPGTYDIYIEPDLEEISGDSCSVVPQLIKNEEIPAAVFTLPLVAQPATLLKVEVSWPKALLAGKPATENFLEGLDGWQIDIIDPTSGRVLSSPATLSLTQEGDIETFSTDVEYAPVLGDDSAVGTELVRLKPPEGVVAPTLVFERGTLDAFQVGKAKINQLEGVPHAIDVSGDVLEGGDQRDETLTGTVKFVAKKLAFLPEGTLFAFVKTVPIDGGKYTAALLPGEYDVYVAPEAGKGLATTKSTLTVAGSPGVQSGKGVSVLAASQVAGVVLGPAGQPVVGASVHVNAAPMATDPLLVAAGTAAVKPQGTTAIVGADGSFIARADPGTYDLSIRPEDDTNFAWMVRPNITVSDPIHDLGELSLPLPVAYDGHVQVPGDVVVPDALIRAYVYLSDSGYTPKPADAKSVLQIAETRAQSDGSFTLLLPSHLN